MFLPFIYADLFDYTFFPYAYDRGYWGYAYDDFFDSMFWAYGSPYSDPGFAAPLPRGGRPTRVSLANACRYHASLHAGQRPDGVAVPTHRERGQSHRRSAEAAGCFCGQRQVTLPTRSRHHARPTLH